MRLKLLPFCLLLSIASLAQDSSFQLKDYKYRTSGFKALLLNIGFAGSVANNNNATGDDNAAKSFSLSPAYVSYQKFISAEKRIHQSGISLLLPDFRFSNSKNGLQETKYSSYQSNLYWSWNDRYYKKGLWFFEFGNQLKTQLAADTRENASTTFKTNHPGISDELSIGIGKGRLERVQDAQMALFILNDLQQQGLLNSTVTAETANAFAQLITDINNKRVFDSRRRRIYELTLIDSFLQSSGLVNKTDIRHFTTVNDNWSFAINPFRMAGSSWYVRLKPGVDYSKNENKELPPNGAATEDKSEKLFVSLTPEIGIEKYVPINLKWQRNIGASIAYALTRNKDNLKFASGGTITEYEYNYSDWQAKFNGFFGMGFYPNNRTQIEGNLVVDAFYNQDRSFQISPRLTIIANYFIGYRTYLSATSAIAYNYLHYLPGNSRSFSANIAMSLSHYIF